MGGLQYSLLRIFALYASRFDFAAAFEYDFIIIGGGTAGLAVANRLTEIPSITVAIIEAGDKVFDNPTVTAVDGFTLAIGTSIDWQYETVNQIHAAGQIKSWPGGKALGGTSTINGMTYVRAQKSQIDSWQAIGNKGWSWDDLLPYYRKSENFTFPTPEEMQNGASYNPSYHGTGGQLNVGFSKDLLNGSLHTIILDTWANLGLPSNNDANGGDVRGFSVWPSTLDSATNIREDSARAYYYRIESRTNLHVFLNTTANKIEWDESVPGELIAKAVQVTRQNGSIGTFKATKEVIVSAGSVRSPALLELSGIGNPRILERCGISTKVSLSGVGENLVDQPLNLLQYNSTEVYDGITSYVAYGAMDDFLATLPTRDTTRMWASQIAAANNNSVSQASIEYLLQIQYDLLEHQVPNAEAIVGTTKTFGAGPSQILAASMWLLLPFSRGNVHINSSDPLVFPIIDPKYFLIDFDLDVQVAIFKWFRKFWATGPVKDRAIELVPGYAILPLNSTDEMLGDYIKKNFGANSHNIGTASMMPRELGGVIVSTSSYEAVACSQRKQV
ncbi:hypothetical protein HYFRA_00003492 [Hymenoscyphus fraxineus]|uniref:Glucose-methanol-choline oxidoreductase N-terminal domain-containing protein n=1 Tax=Hymenoscyphus fraxineus TaxID=746836 RepID=A0A9N9PRN4_9HELO|nr:hypothetical protein HYFRA_00003492 [Hymenoscyphus fraxineus]